MTSSRDMAAATTLATLDSMSSLGTSEEAHTLRAEFVSAAAFPDQSGTPRSLIELRFSASNLANADFLSLSDPFAVVYADHFGVGLQELGRTETVVDDLSPRWTATLVFPQVKNAPSQLVVDIYDRDAKGNSLSQHDFLGRAQLSVDDVLAAPALTYSALLERDPSSSRTRPFTRAPRGTLRVQAEPLRPFYGPERKLELRIRSAALRCRRPRWRDVVQFFELSRQRGRGWTVVYRSENGIRVDEHGFVKFRPARITEQLLHNMDNKRRLRITFFSRNARKVHDMISFFETDASSVVEKHIAPLQLETFTREESFGDISRVSSGLEPDDGNEESKCAFGDAYVEEVKHHPLANTTVVDILADHAGHKQFTSMASDTSRRQRTVRTTPNFVSLH